MAFILQADSSSGTASWLTGIDIEGSLLVARPVNTIVRDTITGDLYVSTNATVATYSLLSSSSNIRYSATASESLVGSTIGAATETPFITRYTIPGNTLRVGSVIRLSGYVDFPTTVGTTTAGIKGYVGYGAAPAVFDITAVDVANSDETSFDVEIGIRSIGAGAVGTINGWTSSIASAGVGTLRTRTGAGAFGFDTSNAMIVVLTTTISSADATTARLQQFNVTVENPTV